MDNRPLPRRDRVRLFRGEYAGVWKRRLQQAGWPPELAGEVSRFLTGDAPLPHWPRPLHLLDEILIEDGNGKRRIVWP